MTYIITGRRPVLGFWRFLRRYEPFTEEVTGPIELVQVYVNVLEAGGCTDLRVERKMEAVHE